eukprot:2749310-Rhodomonas_salina.1
MAGRVAGARAKRAAALAHARACQHKLLQDRRARAERMKETRGCGAPGVLTREKAETRAVIRFVCERTLGDVAFLVALLLLLLSLYRLPALFAGLRLANSRPWRKAVLVHHIKGVLLDFVMAAELLI